MDLTSLSDLVRVEMDRIFRATRGPKVLIIDPALTTALNVVCGYKFLRQHFDKVYPLEKTCPWNASDGATAVYIIRPSAACVKTIADHIGHVKECQGGDPNPQVTRSVVAFVPQRDFVCEEILEQEGVFGDVIITSVPLLLYPVDDDVLSLELPGLFPELIVHGDQTSLPWVAQSIMQLQQQYGR